MTFELAQISMHCSLSGPFKVERHGPDAWRLQSQTALEILYLRGTDRETGEIFENFSILALEVDWTLLGASVTLGTSAGDNVRAVGSAILHAPLPVLYSTLPLGVFDKPAQRFWRRMFLILRMPGGRFLVGLLARLRDTSSRPQSSYS